MIDIVVVGADRIAANGDTAIKLALQQSLLQLNTTIYRFMLQRQNPQLIYL